MGGSVPSRLFSISSSTTYASASFSFYTTHGHIWGGMLVSRGNTLPVRNVTNGLDHARIFTCKWLYIGFTIIFRQEYQAKLPTPKVISLHGCKQRPKSFEPFFVSFVSWSNQSSVTLWNRTKQETRKEIHKQDVTLVINIVPAKMN